LNFGHTLGHAIEAALGYGGLRHGEAVTYGMLFALRLAERRGLEGADAARLRAVLGRLRPPPLPALDPDALLDLVARDKKAGTAGTTWVLPESLGCARRGVAVGASELRAEIEDWLAAPWDSSA
jgi:3-dehydroquinate synthase